MTSLNKSQMEELAVTLRKIWLCRNGVVFQNRMECPSSLILSAKATVRDYQTVMNSGNPDNQV